jgi:hypothetical protein
MFAYVCVCVYVYIYIYTHTYIYTPVRGLSNALFSGGKGEVISFRASFMAKSALHVRQHELEFREGTQRNMQIHRYIDTYTHAQIDGWIHVQISQVHICCTYIGTKPTHLQRSFPFGLTIKKLSPRVSLPDRPARPHICTHI